MNRKISERGIRIGKIEEEDQKKAYQFCQSIFPELKLDKRFAYGLENLKEFFGKPREIFLLAKENKRIVACAGLKELSKTEALIKRFYVVKDFRGRGLADLMLEKIKKFAKEKKYKSIVLDVPHDNLRAKRFYQRHGFSIFRAASYDGWLESKHPEIFEFRKLNLNKN